MMMGGGHRRWMAHATKPKATRATLRRLLVYLKPHALALLFAGLMVVLRSLLRIAGPYISGQAVDVYIIHGDLAGLHRLMLLLLAVHVGTWLTNAAQFMTTITVGQKVLYTMREQLFQHFQRLSLDFFDRSEAGDLMSRLTNDTDAINRTLNMGLAQFVANVLFLVGVLVAMLSLNWRLALVSMSVLPLMLVSTFYFSRRMRVASRKSREKLGEVSAELQETIAGVRVVQAFGREQEAAREFRDINAAHRDANIEAQTVSAAFAPTLDIFSTLGIALVLGAGGVMALDGRVTVGTIFAFLTYVRRFFQPVRAIGMLYTQVQTAIAAAERIFDILNERPKVEDAPDAIPLTSVQGYIRFEHVTFGYREGVDVLRDITFEVQPGQMFAIVGPTGAGKTTLVNLLMRFYDVREGRILVDGHDIRQVQQESLRRQMGMVLQDTFLFSGTVMENIRYGRLEASDEEVIAAAQIARADDFIRRLPQGYQTVLGERGASLSQGQRQLMAIARAVLADPRILILDEATSSVDTRTERLIQAALTELMKGRTSLVIAHRLSTIRNADQVLVLHQGEIIERGTHRELLAARGFYYRLYASQFGEVDKQEDR